MEGNIVIRRCNLLPSSVARTNRITSSNSSISVDALCSNKFSTAAANGKIFLVGGFHPLRAQWDIEKTKSTRFEKGELQNTYSKEPLSQRHLQPHLWTPWSLQLSRLLRGLAHIFSALSAKLDSTIREAWLAANAPSPARNSSLAAVVLTSSFFKNFSPLLKPGSHFPNLILQALT